MSAGRRIWQPPDTVVDLGGSAVSDPMYAGMPAAPSRPTVVTVSSYLLYFSAAASIISAVLSLTTVGTIRDVYADLYDDTANSGMESIIVAASVVGVVINILFAAGLAILAIFNNRGKQGARITTWVVGGIFLCCNGFGLLGNAATSGMNLDSGTTSGPSASEVEARLSDELPGWFTPISTTLTVLIVLALLGAVILLALPGANPYFRKQQVAWDPMNQYPGYPGQPPAYPGYPSQSPYPTYPQHPGQPGPAASGQPPYPQSGPPGDPTPPPGSVSPPSGPAPGPSGGEDPHTGSVPPTDPWSAPSPPPPSSDDKPGRSPTDPA
jgi:hypothetical protein